MTSNIQNIYSDFRSTYEDNPDFIIEFIRNNSIFFNNIKTFINKDELKLYIELSCKYVEALYRKERFNQAADLVDKYQTLIDNEIIRFGDSSVKDAWYYSLSFIKGMACYMLKDYKSSSLIFKTLIDIDKNNDSYKIWFTYSRYRQRIWVVNLIWIVSAAFVLTDILAKQLIENSITRLLISSVGFLGIIINWSYELYIKRSFRKSTQIQFNNK